MLISVETCWNLWAYDLIMGLDGLGIPRFKKFESETLAGVKPEPPFHYEYVSRICGQVVKTDIHCAQEIVDRAPTQTCF